MRILITGGLGFIGSHLCEALALASHELVIVDDLSTGKKEHAPAGAEVIIDDVARAGAFDEVVQGIDACFHLAAIASVELSRTHWLRTHEVNSGALVNLMAAISKTKRPVPVVFASSAAVYGNNAQLPLKEITSPAPISSYGVDKLSCEHNGQIAAHAHGIPNIGLRFFNVYGPRQDPSSPYSGVISIFSHAVLHRTPVTIYGDGEQSRDFI
ncbi:MAG: NAD-dependent epimerase/dehydratase family protein, partial [Alphaproteobacteria bacterium]